MENNVAKAYLRYVRISPRKIQIVCDLILSSGIGFSRADIPEQEQPDPRFFELVPVLRVAPHLFKLGCRNCG